VPRVKKASTAADTTGANLGFEAKLWAAADALRNNMDAAEDKRVVLGLIFLKYISDAFDAKHDELAAPTRKTPLHSSPRSDRARGLRARQRLDVVQPVR